MRPAINAVPVLSEMVVGSRTVPDVDGVVTAGLVLILFGLICPVIVLRCIV